MTTIHALNRSEASDDARKVYDDILKTYTAYKLTEPHEIYRLMGHTPAFLAANWPRSQHLYGGDAGDENRSRSLFSLKEKHLVTLVVSAANNCEYCVRIHTKRLRQLGATNEELIEAVAVAGVTTAFDRFAEGTRAGERPTIPPAPSDSDTASPASSQDMLGPDQIPGLLAHHAELSRVYAEMGRQAFHDQGLLGSRVKTMLAFAVSATNGADYCLASHGEQLVEAGLSQEELVELLLIIDLTCGYNRYVQGLQVAVASNT